MKFMMEMMVPSEPQRSRKQGRVQGVCVLLLSALAASADKVLILEIPPHPVPTGSDVTLRCRLRNGDIIAAFFFFGGSRVGSGPKSELIITNIQQTDEGLYSCSTDMFGSSPQRFLKVKVSQDGSEVEVYEGVESVLLPCQVSIPQGEDMKVMWKHREFKILVHMHGSDVDDLRNQSQRYANRTSMRADALQTGDLSLTLRNPTVSDSGTYTCILQRDGREESQGEVHLKVKASSVSLRRLFCHLVVFCPYCISTGLLLSICYNKKTPNRPAASMEVTQQHEEAQALAEECDDVTADVTTEHAF
ncbi:CD276 antigen-like [Archocentrus centrarchus]|uniref:CD276 antigen-like n=1 Tax=Archocentrus centrarchus TaxID=63155 RepID=UPI0011E9D271|nr:CD276 antigen-like [Archocentrus centrarchus]